MKDRSEALFGCIDSYENYVFLDNIDGYSFWLDLDDEYTPIFPIRINIYRYEDSRRRAVPINGLVLEQLEEKDLPIDKDTNGNYSRRNVDEINNHFHSYKKAYEIAKKIFEI